MYPIITTRFNNATWNENLLYRNKFSCCVYGSPREITRKIPRDSPVYVIEMNNDLNQILGIGLIKNRPFDRYMTSLYNQGNYTRFVYKSNIHVGRDFILDRNRKLVEILDFILFKGKTHLKRGYGFLSLSDKLLRNEKCSDINLNEELCRLFADFHDREKESDSTDVVRVEDLSNTTVVCAYPV